MHVTNCDVVSLNAKSEQLQNVCRLYPNASICSSHEHVVLIVKH